MNAFVTEAPPRAGAEAQPRAAQSGSHDARARCGERPGVGTRDRLELGDVTATTGRPGGARRLDVRSPNAKSRPSSDRRAAASRPCCGCINRMNDLVPASARGHGSCSTARTSTRPASIRRGPPTDRHGVPEAEPVPEVDLRQRGVRPRGSTGYKGDIDELVETEPPAGRALGRGQGQAQAERDCRCRADSSSASASPARSRSSRSPADGRAVLGARSGARRSRSRS